MIPLVIYNGASPWRGPRRFSALVDRAHDGRRFGLDFEAVLVDVGAEAAPALSASPQLRGGLLALKAAATQPGPQLRLVVRQMFQDFQHDESTLGVFLGYLRDVAGRQALPYVEEEAERAQSKEKVMQTIGQYISSLAYRRGKRKGEKRGLERGLERGLKRGREEGRAAALRESCRRVLELRFKRVPASVEDRLKSADAHTLARWLEQATVARSLKAVFATH